MNLYKPTQWLIIQTVEQFALHIKTHKYNACGKMVYEFEQTTTMARESKQLNILSTGKDCVLMNKLHTPR